MKTIKFMAAALSVFAAVSCGSKAESITVGDTTYTAPSKALADSVSYYLGVNYGQMLKQYDFGTLDYNLMVQGMKDFIKADLNSEDINSQFKLNPEEMNETINNYLRAHSEYVAAVRKAEQTEFFEANSKKEGVQVRESGLQYKIIEAGSDVKPAATDTVWVKYEGKLLDGTVFDKTEEDAEPVHFTLNRVVKGWSEGLQLIGEGGKIELAIPAKLGYGERGNQRIAPNSTLLFNVELVKVGKVAAAE